MDLPVPPIDQPTTLNSPLPVEAETASPPAAPVVPPAPSVPIINIAKPTNQSRLDRRFLIGGLLIVLLILAIFFFWNRRSSTFNQTTVSTSSTPTAVTEPAQTVNPDAVGESSTETLQYQLPSGWTEAPAEGEVTPQINFLKRLRSPDGCYTLVVGRFLAGDSPLNNFIISQYLGSNLLNLRHSTQFEVSGFESFTVKPQSLGESFTFFVKGRTAIHGIFASYSLALDEMSEVCSPESPELSALMQSITLP